MGQQHFATPGPGQYYAPKEVRSQCGLHLSCRDAGYTGSIQVGKARASSNNFVSKSTRFKASSANALDQSPGPGTYESNERWVSQQVPPIHPPPFTTPTHRASFMLGSRQSLYSWIDRVFCSPKGSPYLSTSRASSGAAAIASLLFALA